MMYLNAFLRGGAIISLACIVNAAPSFAQDMGTKWYARADFGYSVSADTSGDIFHGTGWGQDFGSAPMFDAGVGATLGQLGSMVDLRADVTAAYRTPRQGAHSAPNTAGTIVLATVTDIETFSVLGTVYADFNVGSSFKPYVGVGLGVADNTLRPLSYTSNGAALATEGGDTSLNFAWQATAGIGYPISDNAMLDFGYHYIDTGHVRSGGNITLVNGTTSNQPIVQSNLKAHEFTMGIRLTF